MSCHFGPFPSPRLLSLRHRPTYPVSRMVARRLPVEGLEEMEFEMVVGLVLDLGLRMALGEALGWFVQ